MWATSGADFIAIDDDKVVRHRAVVPADFEHGFEHMTAPDGAGGWYVLYRRALVRMRFPRSIADRPSWAPTPIVPPAGRFLRALAVDPAGPVWVGTSAGLICWAPERTDVYDTSHGWPDAYIMALFVSQHGVLWGGTANNVAFRLIDGPLVSYRQLHLDAAAARGTRIQLVVPLGRERAVRTLLRRVRGPKDVSTPQVSSGSSRLPRQAPETVSSER